MKNLTRIEIMELALERLNELHQEIWKDSNGIKLIEQWNEHRQLLVRKIVEIENEIEKLKNRKENKK